MQTILLPEFRPTCIPSIFTAKSSSHSRRTSSCSHSISFSRNPSHSFSSFSTPLKIQSLCEIRSNQRKITPGVAPISSVYAPPSNDETEDAKLAQVAKRLQQTARYFKRLGNLGFWGQLACTIVSAVILSFSIVVTGKITSPVTFYATAGGIAAAFIAVFWSYGYIRLSDKLQKTAYSPSKAPPRSDVVQSLKNGIIVNLLGMGAAMLGMQATVGWLMAKSLTTSSNPFYQGVSPMSSPVLALDVFLVQVPWEVKIDS
uniref:Translocon at inner membrane of chloroplasts 21 n=1 Tax=Daucus carota subsp. sativus TaxID=79200 RepID=A0A164VPE0_DAUCS